ncbi:MAG: RNA-directed DNA polymerase [Chloroflexota bacterium]|nr:RNA-directed DNA polymerase [Chloroflexota bacterium]
MPRLSKTETLGLYVPVTQEMKNTGTVTKSALWTAWKDVRRGLHRTYYRDVTDFAEFDIEPELWIDRLLAQLQSGRYEPATPTRFTLAKELGLSRVITFPQIPDLVLYKALAELVYNRSKPSETGHVYFEPNTLEKKRRSLLLETDEPDYFFLSGSTYLAWKRHVQYRKRLARKTVYPYLVLTDISNYFDSIPHSRLVDAIHGTRLDREAVGLLLFLLERLSPRHPYNESAHIGIPVDQFECSRALAHVLLFTHDQRMIAHAGEEAYVRWMDDQTIGVSSYAAGLQALAECGESLSTLNLTPNTAKSRILSSEEVARHFFFDANQELDDIQDALSSSGAAEETIRAWLREAWARHSQQDTDRGEWSKVLRRFYLLAGRCRQRFLLDRSLEDVLQRPTLADRISDYVRVVGRPGEYLEFFLSVCGDARQVYPDVTRALGEGLLRVEEEGQEAARIRKTAFAVLTGGEDVGRLSDCGPVAPLLVLRFGDRRAMPRLRRYVRDTSVAENPELDKAVAVVYASYGPDQLRDVVEASSRLANNYLSEFLRMLHRMRDYREVPKRFKNYRRPAWDSVAGTARVDLRKLLVLRLLRLNDRPAVAGWVRDATGWILRRDLSTFDKALARRLLRPLE